ncbi:MAG TPA: site-specific integrase, partial [Acidimicrobiales bacterium]
RAEKRAERFWTPDQARAFLDATADDRLHPLWALALDTGARRGELSALRWESVDLDGSAVTIRASRTLAGSHVVEGPTKNGKPRVVDLDGRTVAALRAWRVRQARDRLAAGEAWQGGTPGESGYVFTNELGEPYRPNVLTQAFGYAQSGLGLPRIVFHALRHTSASILIAAGVAITVVSARLGHSQVSITLEVYSHLMPNDGAAAAVVIGRALYGAETGT